MLAKSAEFVLYQTSAKCKLNVEKERCCWDCGSRLADADAPCSKSCPRAPSGRLSWRKHCPPSRAERSWSSCRMYPSRRPRRRDAPYRKFGVSVRVSQTWIKLSRSAAASPLYEAASRGTRMGQGELSRQSSIDLCRAGADEVRLGALSKLSR